MDKKKKSKENKIRLLLQKKAYREDEDSHDRCSAGNEDVDCIYILDMVVNATLSEAQFVEICDDLSLVQMYTNDMKVCGEDTRSDIGDISAASVKTPSLKLIDKHNALKLFDEVDVTHEDGESRSRAAHSQRQRGENSAIAEVANVKLLMILGVGPQNLRKLVDKEFRAQAVIQDKFYGECSQKMVNFLHNSVGIIHMNHAESITSFIKERVDEEVKQEGSLTQADIKKKLGNEKHLHKAFAYFDQNKRGYIEIEELSDSLQNDLSPNHEEVIKAIIRSLDTDKDKK
ncbi:hypothetical protein M5K25_005702 [Dendrobium thyrsiflorum]|uniref:EF-hand domain-containing protein n=1 Tax=Dendrobium thyrsiflorum TaxID=117978 RepID=A0ABD0VJ96_DENTH